MENRSILQLIGVMTVMDYCFLNKEEYINIPLYQIIHAYDKVIDLPFLIMKNSRCNQSRHRHKYIQIIYIYKGKLKHIINNKSFDVLRGDIFVIPPYIPHYFIDINEKFEIVEFEFIPEFIDDMIRGKEDFINFAYLEPFLVSEGNIKPFLNLTGNIQHEVENILNEAINEYNLQNKNFEIIIKALLLKLLVIISRESKENIQKTETKYLFDTHRDALENAIKYIDDNYHENLTLDTIARKAMMSKSYFSYVFKQITRMTFIEYLNNLRVIKAIDLLKKQKDMKISDISYEVGFKSITHFNRVFLQETGVIPMAFKKQKY